MLSKILEVLASNDSLTFAQLAKKVGQTEQELISIFEQLERMGYIRHKELCQTCSSSCDTHSESNHCQACSFAKTERHVFTWALTPKGEIINS